MVKKKNKVIFILDALMTVFSIVLSLILLGYPLFKESLNILTVVFVFAIFRIIFNVGKTILRRLSISEIKNIILSNTISLGVVFVITPITKLRIDVAVVTYLLTTLIQIISRILYIQIYDKYFEKREVGYNKKVAVFGAGKAGEMIAQEILANTSLGYQFIGFFDDNTRVRKNTLLGYKIFGDRKEVSEVVREYEIDIIYIAMPSVSKKIQNDIAEICYKTGAEVKQIPSFTSLLDKTDIMKVAKSVDIVDLLNRNEISLDHEKVGPLIKDQTILVTGAGGSIGSELVRQIVRQKPKEIILIDIAENGVYSIQQEILMDMRANEIELVTVSAYICSISDKMAIQNIFDKHHVDVVLHAAAHKHVPLMETSPLQAIKNNIFGTKNLIELSSKNGVKTFLNISTDKAVNPTNIMGATKRFIEMMLLNESKISRTNFVAVRFGNVLGSNGSVIPLFTKQISHGGPVTVTHPNIVRYFMTIPEAVSLVLEAATYAKGGEIFVLDMGEPVKILSMAEKMIELSGFKPYEDIKIEFTGLRKGEKLYEELILNEEGLRKTSNELIFIISQVDIDQEQIELNIKDMQELIDTNASRDKVIEVMQKIIPTFKHEEN